MKKVIFLLVILSSLQATAQVEEGILKYSMTIQGEQPGTINPMVGNSSVTIYFKKGKSLTEMSTPIYSMQTLYDSKGLLLLMNAVGKQFYTRKSPEDLQKEKLAKNEVAPMIALSKEKKKILGYDCSKATITLSDKSGKKVTLTVWCTDKIHNIPDVGPVTADIQVKIKGIPLEIQMNEGPINSLMRATDVSVKPVAESVFNLSTSGYTERKPNPGQKR